MSTTNSALRMFHNGGPNDRSRDHERDRLRRNVQQFRNKTSNVPANRLQIRRLLTTHNNIDQSAFESMNHSQQMTGGVQQQEQEPQNESPSIDFNNMPRLDLVREGNMSGCSIILYITFLSFY